MRLKNSHFAPIVDIFQSSRSEGNGRIKTVAEVKTNVDDDDNNEDIDVDDNDDDNVDDDCHLMMTEMTPMTFRRNGPSMIIR